MNKLLLKGVLFSMFAFGLVSCSDSDNDDTWQHNVTPTGVYILNNGKMGHFLSNLSYYDSATGSLSADVFANQNRGLELGDTGEDLLIYGTKMYISVTLSDKIFITDRGAKLLSYSDDKKTIIDLKDKTTRQPRYFAAYKDHVYVSLQSGHVARIDTTSMLIDKTIKVGSHPQHMTIVSNKLYVANSGQGEDNTISIINLDNFAEELPRIEVVVNPTGLTSDILGNIYVISNGTYGKVKSSFQKIDTKTKVVTEIGKEIATSMCVYRDKVYLLNAYYPEQPKLSYYDIRTEQLVNESYITDGTVVPNPFSLTIDPSNGSFYIGSSDFVNTGDMYVYSAAGKLLKRFDTAGVNPMGAYFFPEAK